MINKLLIDLPEIIETPRLKLQAPKAGFGKKLHEAMMDGYEDSVRWLNWEPTPPDIETVEIECRKHHSEFILRERMRYIIIDKVTDNVVGRCAFAPLLVNWQVPQFGIAYFIRKKERSKGYGTEATHAMTLLAFKLLKAKKVEIYCEVENISSAKIPLKLGFELEYTQKGGWPRPDGELANLQTYSIFSESKLPKLDIKW